MAPCSLSVLSAASALATVRRARVRCARRERFCSVSSFQTAGSLMSDRQPESTPHSSPELRHWVTRSGVSVSPVHARRRPVPSGMEPAVLSWTMFSTKAMPRVALSAGCRPALFDPVAAGTHREGAPPARCVRQSSPTPAGLTPTGQQEPSPHPNGVTRGPGPANCTMHPSDTRGPVGTVGGAAAPRVLPLQDRSAVTISGSRPRPRGFRRPRAQALL